MNPTVATQSASALEMARAVIQTERHALEQLENRLGFTFEAAVSLILACKGRLILTGMGKSGHIAQKLAATFSSTGTPAYFLHPAEGIHGDLGLLSPDDCVIALSYSGETAEILHVLPVVKRFQLPLISLTGNPQSTLASHSQVTLDVSVPKEACPHNLAPTASTTAALVMGDALAMAVMQHKGFAAEDFAVFHPGGLLGKRLLLTVADVMHQGDAIPTVTINAPFSDALVEMTSKKLGMTVVVDEAGQTQGILTDGDLRRILTQSPNPMALAVKDVYHAHPKTIAPEALAADALALMEQHQITSLIVQNTAHETVGVLHLHDLLKTGLA